MELSFDYLYDGQATDPFNTTKMTYSVISSKLRDLPIDNVLKSIMKHEILHRDHYKLLRYALKSEHVKGGITATAASRICQSMDKVRQSQCILLQKEYLKCLCRLYSETRDSSMSEIQLNKGMLLQWMKENHHLHLDKYFFKAGCFLVSSKTFSPNDCIIVLDIIRNRGYDAILLRSNKDNFIQLPKTITAQLQAQALKTTLTIIAFFYKSENEDFLVPLMQSINIKTPTQIKSYIQSLHGEDDILMLSNLTLGCQLHYMISEKIHFAFTTILLGLFDPIYWFHYFIRHLKYDHKIVIDWLLEGSGYCENYMKNILTHLLCNFSDFTEFIRKNVRNSGTEIEELMDFLVRINLAVEEISPSLSNLIDQIELEYEKISVSSDHEDPLSSILSQRFSSQLSLDSATTPALVNYSDSD